MVLHVREKPFVHECYASGGGARAGVHPSCVCCFLPGGDSQHPETEEAARQVGVRLGLCQGQVRPVGHSDRLLSPPQPPATSPTWVRERPLHGQMAVSQRPDGEETGKGRRSLHVQGTGGTGRQCHQPCSRQSRGNRQVCVAPRICAPTRWFPSHAAALPRVPLTSHHAGPGAAGCVLTWPALSWRALVVSPWRGGQQRGGRPTIGPSSCFLTRVASFL